MKRLALLAVVACVCGCALSGSARAGPVTYTEQFTGAGSLNGTPYTGALVTFTFTGDTANIMHPEPLLFNNRPGNATVTVPGIGTATFTDAVAVFDNQGNPSAGFTDFTSLNDLLNVENGIFSSYALDTSIGPVSGQAVFGPGQGIPTTLGSFVIDSIAGDTVTFTATLSTVPEPGSFMLVAVAALAVGRRWRAGRKG
jgi:hypothetical protein